MKTLIVDSDSEKRNELLSLLSIYRTFRVEAELGTVDQAFDFIETHEVDVVFINYQPADPRETSTGDYLSAILPQSHPNVQVVVYGDQKEYAYWACRSQSAGFLLTPFDPLALQALVNRLTYVFDLQQTKRETANRSIMIKTRSGY